MFEANRELAVGERSAWEFLERAPRRPESGAQCEEHPASGAQAARLAGLLARSALRDQEAFRELYDRTAAKLFGVALRILGRQDWAEDVLQECYLSIWNHAADYTVVKGAPLAWMTSIVRNRCFDWLRRPQQEATGEGYDIAVEAWHDESSGPLEQLVASAETATLARSMDALEPGQRQSIMLAYYRGLTHAEVASHMKQPLGTVKSWIRRGLERLKNSPAMR